jgi:uncharacterized protein YcbX
MELWMDFALSFLVLFIPIFVFFFQNGQKTSSSIPGCKRIGLLGRTNLPKPNEKLVEETWACRVKSLWIYPLKSARGIELEEGTVIHTGMEFDRLFSLARWKAPSSTEKANNPNAEGHWEFLSQRHNNLLALLKTELYLPDPTSPSYNPALSAVRSGGILLIRYPLPSWRFLPKRYETFTLPLNDPSPEAYPLTPFTIWKDSPLALDMSSHLLPSLSTFLGLARDELALFRVSSSHLREIYRCAPRASTIGYQPVTGFSDAYPLHIVNLSSVTDVASRISTAIPSFSVLRFRPNIIISGAPPYSEDEWKKVKIGEGEYEVVCRTARCLLPNIEQETGERHPVEPNRVLRSFRIVDKGVNCACFGMMMVPWGEGVVRVGDEVSVLGVGEHLYLRQ